MGLITTLSDSNIAVRWESCLWQETLNWICAENSSGGWGFCARCYPVPSLRENESVANLTVVARKEKDCTRNICCRVWSREKLRYTAYRRGWWGKCAKESSCTRASSRPPVGYAI